MEDPTKWSVDKRIPLPSIIAGAVFLIVQTSALAWLFSNVYYRVGNLEEFVKSSQPQASQIAVIQEKVTTLQTSIDKIERWLQVLRPPISEPRR